MITTLLFIPTHMKNIHGRSHYE